MFESLVTGVLTNLLGNFIDPKCFSSDKINIAVWSGYVVLRDLELKPDIFAQLPTLRLIRGMCGSIELKIPWNRLHLESMVVTIDDIHMLVAIDDDFDSVLRNFDPYVVKKKLIEELYQEAIAKRELEEYQEASGSAPPHDGFAARLINKILDNLELHIRRIHIRVEDRTRIEHPYALGITVESIHVQSTDSSWESIQSNQIPTRQDPLIYKSVLMNHFSIYLNPDCTIVKGLDCATCELNAFSSAFSASIPKRTDDMIDDEQSYPMVQQHHFLLKPIDVSAHVTVFRDIGDSDTPKFEVNIAISEVALRLEDFQYCDLLTLLKALQVPNHIEKQKKYIRFRPDKSVLESPCDWWKYAINVTLEEIESQKSKWSWVFMNKRRADRIQYVALWKKYKAHLLVSDDIIEEDIKTNNLDDQLEGSHWQEQGGSWWSPSDSKRLEAIEQRRSVEEVLYFRFLADLENDRLHAANDNIRQSLQPSLPTPGPKNNWEVNTLSDTDSVDTDGSETSIPTEVKFRSWGAWVFGWTSKITHFQDYPNSQTRSTQKHILSDIEMRELYRILEHEPTRKSRRRQLRKDKEENMKTNILDDGELDLADLSETVKSRVAFVLEKGSITLAYNRQSREAKPWKYFAYEPCLIPEDFIVANFSGLSLSTVAHKNSFKLEMSLQSIAIFDESADNPAFSKIVSRKHDSQLEKVSKLNMGFGITSNMIESPTFLMVYETNPPIQPSADAAIYIHLDPLEIMFAPTATCWKYLSSFTTAPNEISSWAEREIASLNDIVNLRSRTEAKLKYVLASRVAISMGLNIHAPIIIIPESTTDVNCSCLVIDLGRIGLRTERLCDISRAEFFGPNFTGSSAAKSSVFRSSRARDANNYTKYQNRNNFATSFVNQLMDEMDKGEKDEEGIHWKESFYDKYSLSVSEIRVRLASYSDIRSDGPDSLIKKGESSIHGINYPFVPKHKTDEDDFELIESFSIYINIRASILPLDATLTRLYIHADLPELVVNLSVEKYLKLVALLTHFQFVKSNENSEELESSEQILNNGFDESGLLWSTSFMDNPFTVSKASEVGTENNGELSTLYGLYPAKIDGVTGPYSSDLESNAESDDTWFSFSSSSVDHKTLSASGADIDDELFKSISDSSCSNLEKDSRVYLDGRDEIAPSNVQPNTPNSPTANPGILQRGGTNYSRVDRRLFVCSLTLPLISVRLNKPDSTTMTVSSDVTNEKFNGGTGYHDYEKGINDSGLIILKLHGLRLRVGKKTLSTQINFGLQSLEIEDVLTNNQGWNNMNRSATEFLVFSSPDITPPYASQTPNRESIVNFQTKNTQRAQQQRYRRRPRSRNRVLSVLPSASERSEPIDSSAATVPAPTTLLDLTYSIVTENSQDNFVMRHDIDVGFGCLHFNFDQSYVANVIEVLNDAKIHIENSTVSEIPIPTIDPFSTENLPGFFQQNYPLTSSLPASIQADIDRVRNTMLEKRHKQEQEKSNFQSRELGNSESYKRTEQRNLVLAHFLFHLHTVSICFSDQGELLASAALVEAEVKGKKNGMGISSMMVSIGDFRVYDLCSSKSVAESDFRIRQDGQASRRNLRVDEYMSNLSSSPYGIHQQYLQIFGKRFLSSTLEQQEMNSKLSAHEMETKEYQKSALKLLVVELERELLVDQGKLDSLSEQAKTINIAIRVSSEPTDIVIHSSFIEGIAAFIAQGPIMEFLDSYKHDNDEKVKGTHTGDMINVDKNKSNYRGHRRRSLSLTWVGDISQPDEKSSEWSKSHIFSSQRGLKSPVHIERDTFFPAEEQIPQSGQHNSIELPKTPSTSEPAANAILPNIAIDCKHVRIILPSSNISLGNDLHRNPSAAVKRRNLNKWFSHNIEHGVIMDLGVVTFSLNNHTFSDQNPVEQFISRTSADYGFHVAGLRIISISDMNAILKDTEIKSRVVLPYKRENLLHQTTFLPCEVVKPFLDILNHVIPENRLNADHQTYAATFSPIVFNIHEDNVSMLISVAERSIYPAILSIEALLSKFKGHHNQAHLSEQTNEPIIRNSEKSSETTVPISVYLILKEISFVLLAGNQIFNQFNILEKESVSFEKNSYRSETHEKNSPVPSKKNGILSHLARINGTGTNTNQNRIAINSMSTHQLEEKRVFEPLPFLNISFVHLKLLIELTGGFEINKTQKGALPSFSASGSLKDIRICDLIADKKEFLTYILGRAPLSKSFTPHTWSYTNPNVHEVGAHDNDLDRYASFALPGENTSRISFSSVNEHDESAPHLLSNKTLDTSEVDDSSSITQLVNIDLRSLRTTGKEDNGMPVVFSALDIDISILPIRLMILPSTLLRIECFARHIALLVESLLPNQPQVYSIDKEAENSDYSSFSSLTERETVQEKRKQVASEKTFVVNSYRKIIPTPDRQVHKKYRRSLRKYSLPEDALDRQHSSKQEMQKGLQYSVSSGPQSNKNTYPYQSGIHSASDMYVLPLLKQLPKSHRVQQRWHFQLDIERIELGVCTSQKKIEASGLIISVGIQSGVDICLPRNAKSVDANMHLSDLEVIIGPLSEFSDKSADEMSSRQDRYTTIVEPFEMDLHYTNGHMSAGEPRLDIHKLGNPSDFKIPEHWDNWVCRKLQINILPISCRITYRDLPVLLSLNSSVVNYIASRHDVLKIFLNTSQEVTNETLTGESNRRFDDQTIYNSNSKDTFDTYIYHEEQGLFSNANFDEEFEPYSHATDIDIIDHATSSNLSYQQFQLVVRFQGLDLGLHNNIVGQESPVVGLNFTTSHMHLDSLSNGYLLMEWSFSVEAWYNNMRLVCKEPLIEPWTASGHIIRPKNSNDKILENQAYVEEKDSSPNEQWLLNFTSAESLQVNVTDAFLANVMAASRAWQWVISSQNSSVNAFNPGVETESSKIMAHYSTHWIRNETGLTLCYWGPACRKNFVGPNEDQPLDFITTDHEHRRRRSLSERRHSENQLTSDFADNLYATNSNERLPATQLIKDITPMNDIGSKKELYVALKLESGQSSGFMWQSESPISIDLVESSRLYGLVEVASNASINDTGPVVHNCKVAVDVVVERGCKFFIIRSTMAIENNSNSTLEIEFVNPIGKETTNEVQWATKVPSRSTVNMPAHILSVGAGYLLVRPCNMNSMDVKVDSTYKVSADLREYKKERLNLSLFDQSEVASRIDADSGSHCTIKFHCLHQEHRVRPYTMIARLMPTTALYHKKLMFHSPMVIRNLTASQLEFSLVTPQDWRSNAGSIASTSSQQASEFITNPQQVSEQGIIPIAESLVWHVCGWDTPLELMLRIKGFDWSTPFLLQPVKQSDFGNRNEKSTQGYPYRMSSTEESKSTSNGETYHRICMKDSESGANLFLSVEINISLEDHCREIMIYVPYWLVNLTGLRLEYQYDSNRLGSEHNSLLLAGQKVDEREEPENKLEKANQNSNYRRNVHIVYPLPSRNLASDMNSNNPTVIPSQRPGIKSMHPSRMSALHNKRGKSSILTSNSITKQPNQSSLFSDIDPINGLSDLFTNPQNQDTNTQGLDILQACHADSMSDISSLRISVRDSHSTNINSLRRPQSKPFGLDKTGTSSEVEAADSRSGKIYSIGYSINRAKGVYSRTKIISFTPRFLLINNLNTSIDICHSPKDFDVRTRSLDEDSAAQNEGFVHLKPGTTADFHWNMSFEKSRMIRCRLASSDGWYWSGAIPLNDVVGEHVVQMRHESKRDIQLVSITLKLDGPCMCVYFRRESIAASPYRIENYSLETLRMHQTGVQTTEVLLPHHSLPYAWDEPTARKTLVIHMLPSTADDYSRPIRIGTIELDKIQKLPNALNGNLSIEVCADGPTRVLRVTDTRLRSERRNNSTKKHKSHRRYRTSSEDIVDKVETELLHPTQGSLLQHFISNSLFRIELKLYGLGISVIDRSPKELVYISISNIEVELLSSEKDHSENNPYGLQHGDGIERLERETSTVITGVHVRVGDMQIDNQLENTPFPVLMQVTRPLKMKDWSTSSAVDICVVKHDGYTGIQFIRFLQVSLLPASFQVDASLLYQIAPLIVQGEEIEELHDSENLGKENIRFGKQGKVAKNLDNKLSQPWAPKMYKGQVLRNNERERTYLEFESSLEVGVDDLSNFLEQDYDTSITLAFAPRNSNMQSRKLSIPRLSKLNALKLSSNSSSKFLSIHGGLRTADSRARKIMVSKRENKKLYFESFFINPIHVTISFSLGNSGQNNNTATLDDRANSIVKPLRLILHAIGASVTQIANASLLFKPMKINHSFVEPDALVARLISHYQREALRQAYVILGSVDVLGNPLIAWKNMAKGLQDFFFEPVYGITQSPHEFIFGMGRGTRSLARASVYTFLDFYARILSTFSLGLGEACTKLDAYTGYPATTSIYHGIAQGITGVIVAPMHSLDLYGFGGLLPGFFAGAFGLFLKPMLGVSSGISSTIVRLRDASNPSIPAVLIRVRPPRYINSRTKQLKVYSYVESLGEELVSKVRGGQYRTDGYLGHLELVLSESELQKYIAEDFSLPGKNHSKHKKSSAEANAIAADNDYVETMSQTSTKCLVITKKRILFLHQRTVLKGSNTDVEYDVEWEILADELILALNGITKVKLHPSVTNFLQRQQSGAVPKMEEDESIYQPLVLYYMINDDDIVDIGNSHQNRSNGPTARNGRLFHTPIGMLNMIQKRTIPLPRNRFAFVQSMLQQQELLVLTQMNRHHKTRENYVPSKGLSMITSNSTKSINALLHLPKTK